MLDEEITLVWDEGVQGYPTLRSGIPDTGISLNNTFYTFKNGIIWEENSQDESISRNSFYGPDYDSEITLIFNDSPSSIKDFKTVGYEGIGSWSTEVATDQEASIINSQTIPPVREMVSSILPTEFVNREGKNFGYIRGVYTGTNTPDITKPTVQGLGRATSVVTQGDFYEATVHGLPSILKVDDRIYFSRPNMAGDFPDELMYGGQVTSVTSTTFQTASIIEPGDYVEVANLVYRNNPDGVAQNVNPGITTFSDTNVWAIVDAPVRIVSATAVGIGPGQLVEYQGTYYRNILTSTSDLPDITDGIINTNIFTDFTNTTLWVRVNYFGPQAYSTNDFLVFAKNELVETSGLKGFFAEVKFTTADNTKAELFSVNSEVVHSSD